MPSSKYKSILGPFPLKIPPLSPFCTARCSSSPWTQPSFGVPYTPIPYGTLPELQDASNSISFTLVQHIHQCWNTSHNQLRMCLLSYQIMNAYKIIFVNYSLNTQLFSKHTYDRKSENTTKYLCDHPNLDPHPDTFPHQMTHLFLVSLTPLVSL